MSGLGNHIPWMVSDDDLSDLEPDDTLDPRYASFQNRFDYCKRTLIELHADMERIRRQRALQRGLPPLVTVVDEKKAEELKSVVKKQEAKRRNLQYRLEHGDPKTPGSRSSRLMRDLEGKFFRSRVVPGSSGNVVGKSSKRDRSRSAGSDTVEIKQEVELTDPTSQPADPTSQTPDSIEENV